MQIKKAWETLIGKSVKSFNTAYPNLGAALPLVFGKNTFTYDLRGYQAYNNKIFYAATNILVRKMVEAPIIFNRKKSKASKLRKYYSKAISNEERAVIKEESLQEVEDHELNKLFDNPNEYQSGIELMEDFWYNYTHGDGIMWFEALNGELTRNTKPVKIHSLNPERVAIKESNDQFNRVERYIYTTWNGIEVPIPKEQILHLRHWNPNLDDLKGLGVNKIASMDISLNRSNNIAQGAAYANGGRGDLLSSDITTDKEGDVVEKMTAEQMEVLRETMTRELAGAHNNRKMYFTNGMVNVQKLGDTLAEMELINSENANWKSIFAVVGVPVALAPITEAATENNVKAGYKALVTNLVVSELRKFDQKLNQKVQQWWPDIIACHDLTEFTELAPDLEIMKNIYGAPPITVDSHLTVFGHETVGGELGNARLVPSGMMNLKDLIINEFDGVEPSEEL